MLMKMNIYRASQHISTGNIPSALSILLANMDIFTVGMHILENVDGKGYGGKWRYYVCWGDVD